MSLVNGIVFELYYVKSLPILLNHKHPVIPTREGHKTFGTLHDRIGINCSQTHFDSKLYKTDKTCSIYFELNDRLSMASFRMNFLTSH